jgi:hypothetical protein
MNRNPEYTAFLENWQQIMWGGVALFVGIAILIQLLYWIKFAFKRTFKEKYDFASQQEINFIFYSFVSFAVAFALWINTLSSDAVGVNWMYFAIRAFISICGATLIIYITNLLLKFVYPGFLAKKLNRLRYTPRKNPKTGHLMRLLSEDEEDVHLDEGMQAEEQVFSVDYDVWVDEVSGEVKIEKYKGYLEAQECDRCGFQTLKLEEEEIIKVATEEEEGELIKHYKCSYCNRIKHRHHQISRIKKAEDYSLPSKLKFKDEKDQEVVSFELKTVRRDGTIRTYDFETRWQLKAFLEEISLEEKESEDQEEKTEQQIS